MVATDLEQLGRAVKRTQYRHYRALETALSQVGTTLAQWDALRAIDRTPGSSAHFLAGETFQSDQSFGTLITRLIARGLVERRVGTGRKNEHYLTTEGKTILEAGRPIALEIIRESFSPLTQAEQAQLLALLNRSGGPAT